MSPTVGKLDRAAHVPLIGKAVVTGITIHLQRALEAFEKALAMFASPAWCVKTGNAGRISTTPGSVVTGQSPEIPSFSLAPSRIKHRHRGFVHEQLV